MPLTGDMGGQRSIMCTTLQGTWGHRGGIGLLCAQPYRGHMRVYMGIMCTTLQGT